MLLSHRLVKILKNVYYYCPVALIQPSLVTLSCLWTPIFQTNKYVHTLLTFNLLKDERNTPKKDDFTFVSFFLPSVLSGIAKGESSEVTPGPVKLNCVVVHSA